MGFRDRGSKWTDLDPEWLISEPHARSAAEAELQNHLTDLNRSRANDEPSSRAYAKDLYQATRLSIRLGDIDNAVQLADELTDYVAHGGSEPPELAGQAHYFLLMLAALLRRAKRYEEALQLDRKAQNWFEQRRDSHEDDFVRAVAGVSDDLVGQGDYDGAIKLLTAEIKDRPSRRRPFSDGQRMLFRHQVAHQSARRRVRKEARSDS